MEREILTGLITLSTGALVSFIFEILQNRSKRLKSLSLEWKRMVVLLASTVTVLINTVIGLKMPFVGGTFSAAILNSFVVTAVAFAVYHLVIEKRIVVRLIDFSDLKEDSEPEEKKLPTLVGPHGSLYFPPDYIDETEDS